METDHRLGKQIIQKLGKNLRKMSVISSTKSKLTVLGRNCMNCPKLLGSTVNFDKGTQYSHKSKNKNTAQNKLTLNRPDFQYLLIFRKS